MLVHRRVTPSSMSPVPILYTWVERDNVGYSFLSKETTRWQGLGVEPPTFRSEVQYANHYTTAPSQKQKQNHSTIWRALKVTGSFNLPVKTLKTIHCKNWPASQWLAELSP